MKSGLLFLIICATLMPGCLSVTPTPTAEPVWVTFTNEEYGYQFEYPAGVKVEITNKDAGQVRVDAGAGDPFQVTATREYSPGDALYYLDTQAVGERRIGKNLWSEYSLPDGYCDAVGCSPPLYALQMESAGVLYTVTFYSQETTTEQQEKILSTFRISGRPGTGRSSHTFAKAVSLAA